MAHCEGRSPCNPCRAHSVLRQHLDPRHRRVRNCVGLGRSRTCRCSSTGLHCLDSYPDDGLDVARPQVGPVWALAKVMVGHLRHDHGYHPHAHGVLPGHGHDRRLCRRHRGRRAQSPGSQPPARLAASRARSPASLPSRREYDGQPSRPSACPPVARTRPTLGEHTRAGGPRRGRSQAGSDHPAGKFFPRLRSRLGHSSATRGSDGTGHGREAINPSFWHTSHHYLYCTHTWRRSPHRERQGADDQGQSEHRRPHLHEPCMSQTISAIPGVAVEGCAPRLRSRSMP